MAKVSLRIYNREIENLIDRGNINEAISHCHHILRTFPKHLATYRLLGKAYLELKRYNEAVDIFGRVLMSVPDDFVSHVGMSIINDEGNNLDDSIWHMERAFEAQPSNAAIQGELQRLYGRRDGREPPKIRMTRGALAHMYVQGELYPQAIAEIRAVLAEDPQRADMQVLLALAYFRGGQKADASDMCTQLLKRYTYCFDANRIMVDLLPSAAGAAESTQVYRMRVGELDPYASFTKGSVFQTYEVADAAINLERLEYNDDEASAGPGWDSSLGLVAGISSAVAVAAATSSNEPDRSKGGGFSNSQSNLFAEPQTPTPNSQGASESSNEIPDFLRDAGWGESKTPEQPTSFFDEESASNDLTPAEIPDWLKGQVPSDTAQPAVPQPEPAQAIETPDWLLDNSQDSKSTPVQPGNIPDWLSGLDTPQASTPEPVQDANVPDWLSGLDTPQASTPEPVQEANVPDWLSGLDTSQASAPEPVQDANVPDWLSGLDTPQASAPEPVQEDNVPDWLSGSDTPETSAIEPAQAGNMPDWLNDMEEPSAPTPSVESLGSTAQEQDDAMAWLEMLAVKHGAKPEELVSDPIKRLDTPPEWVSQAQSIGEAQSASALETEKSDLESERVENALNIDEQDFADFEDASTTAPAADETGIWLQSLDEEEKQAQSSSASNDIPEWIQDSQPESEKHEEQSLHRADIPEWLSDTQQPQSSGDQFEFAEQEADAQKSDLPNWLSDVEKDVAPQSIFASQIMPENDLSDWLNGLDDEPGLPFDAVPTPDSILFSQRSSEPAAKSQEPIDAKSELFDWLSDVDSQNVESTDEWKNSIQEESSVSAPEQTETLAPVSQTEDLPSWLQHADEEQTAIADDDDTPPWLHREKWEAEELQTPMPTSPSDWHPIESKPVPPQPIQPESTPVQKHEIPVETPKTFVPQDVPSPQPIPAQYVVPLQQSLAQLEEPVKKKKQLGLPAARKAQSEAPNAVAVLNQAKAELDRGDIPAALAHYEKLIKKGKHLEETIRDLSESIYRYPVEVGIWQTLGDAYMRANRLKEALEAYNKAEELIR
jgi:tetratricopeptide (TPR) repeat protein